MYLARRVSYLLTNEEIDRIGAEWRVYEMADVPIDWIQKRTNSLNNIGEHVPIDEYWCQVLSTTTLTGSPQYLVLTKLVKCLLSLSHGNSDVERGFSQNNNLVSDDRSSLNESSINGLRATKAGVKFFGDGKTHLVSLFISYLTRLNSFSRCQLHLIYFQMFKRHIHATRKILNNKRN